MVILNAVEARVLGSLMEKEMTTPENYPLSLNALVNACNQKSSREPVMELSESDARGALFELDQMALVRTMADSRVSKFEHRVRDGINLKRDEFAVVCLLLLRGPQTAAELRARAERLYSFDDVAAVMTTLERLAGREEAVTKLMARQPGAREARWVHLLCGPVAEAVVAAATAGGRERGGGEARGAVESELVERVAALEEMLLAMEQRVHALEERLGEG